MAFSVTTIQSRLEKRLGNIDDVDFILEIASDLNQFLYNVMFGEDPERFISTSSYTVTSSTLTQALPAGFRDTSEFGCGFFVQNTDGTASSRQLTPTGYGSKDLGYYITGTNVVFTGINTTQTFVLRYIPVLADIDSLDDTFVAPDENKELVLEGIVLYYYRYNEDSRESDQDLRFTRLLSLFKDGLSKGPKVIGLPPVGGRTGFIRNDIPVY